MCIECWWECLNRIQQLGIFIIGTLVFVWGLVGFLELVIEKKTPPWYKWPVVIYSGVLLSCGGLAVACCVLYGLYGAIACMF